MTRLQGPAARLIAASALVAAFAGTTFAQGTGSAPAQSAPAQSAPAATPAPALPDPVVATVNGDPIHLSEVSEAVQGLPADYRNMPAPMLFPLMVDQLIDRRALVAEAKRAGLDKDPAVQRQIEAARDRALQQALIQRQVGPAITEDAIRARYNRDIAGKPGEDEVRARHILVPTEEEAKKVIAELKKGASFADLAKKYSKDPGAAAQGGDLGFFKKDEMVPEFAAAAFALQPGQFTQAPVKSQFGWHVIKLEEKRRAEPPSLEQVHDELRQKMIQDGVQKAVQQARNEVKVEKFNMDGSAQRPTDSAEPPPAPAK